LTIVNIIVVTRPDYEIGFSHVTDKIRERIIDLRKAENKSAIRNPQSAIYITDVVQIDVSATEIRQKIKENSANWNKDVPLVVAKYIEKYGLYRTQ